MIWMMCNSIAGCVTDTALPPRIIGHTGTYFESPLFLFFALPYPRFPKFSYKPLGEMGPNRY